MDIVERFYAQCWAVVLPSRYEGFGLPLVESLARNTPVLCSRLIPFEEQVERYGAHNWVKWFSPDNSTELATLLEEIISHKKAPLPDQFPRENLKKWTWKQVANRYLEIFEELDQSSSSTQQVS
jgi:glycosyltransferase involved in cell wall biosynthesis